MEAAAENVPTRRRASRAIDALVGERAHVLIWRSGLKQGEVADLAGIEPTAFGKKLRGRNGWAIQDLVNVAHVLNSSVAYLVGETDESGPDRPNPRMLVPKVAGSIPVGGTSHEIVSLDERRAQRAVAATA